MCRHDLKTTQKRKGSCLFATIAAAMMLTACGSSPAPVSGNAVQQPADLQETGTAQDNHTGTETGNGQDAPSAETPETAPSASDEKFVFEYQGVAVEVDTDAAPVIEALGEPKGYFEAASCAFEGLDKVYTYNDFEISTYPAGDADFISLIVFRSDIISTPEGVSIGSKAAKVADIYGEGTEQDGMVVYEKGGMKLCFIIQEDKVVSVEYHSSTLD